MNPEEALTIVEQALSEDRLSKLQVTVFRRAWEEQSYQAIAKTSGYELGYVKQTGSQLWQLLSKAFGEKVTKSNVQLVLKRKAREKGQELRFLGASHDSPLQGLRITKNQQHLIQNPKPARRTQSDSEAGERTRSTDGKIQNRRDWGDAPDASVFYGRNQELVTLEQWIVQDGCRLIGLFGMGGVGITSLSVKLAKQIQ